MPQVEMRRHEQFFLFCFQPPPIDVERLSFCFVVELVKLVQLRNFDDNLESVVIKKITFAVVDSMKYLLNERIAFLWHSVIFRVCV